MTPKGIFRIIRNDNSVNVVFTDIFYSQCYNCSLLYGYMLLTNFF